jgi:hypothetical protein
MKDEETPQDKSYWDSLIKEFLQKHPEIESAEVVTVFDQDCLKTVSKSSKRIGIHPINKT